MPSVAEIKQDLVAQTPKVEKLLAEHENALSRSRELNAKLEYALELIKENPPIVDGVQLASEMGRLDTISNSLTVLGVAFAVLGVIIAIGSFFSFKIFRNDVVSAAKDEAGTVIQELAKKELRLTKAFLEKEARKATVRLFEQYKNSISVRKSTKNLFEADDEIGDDNADRIAEGRGKEQ